MRTNRSFALFVLTIAFIMFAVGFANAASTQQPTVQTMQALANRIAQGDSAAFNQLQDTADQLYRGMDYAREKDRAISNLTLMQAAYDVLAKEATKGNRWAFDAIKKSLKNKSLSNFAPIALGIMATAGNKEAVDMLIHYKQWGIPKVSAVLALQEAGRNGNPDAVAFMRAIIDNPADAGLAPTARRGLPPANAAKQPGTPNPVTTPKPVIPTPLPPTDADPAVKALADSVVQAINEKNQVKYMALFHPDCLRDLTENQRWYLQEKMIVARFENSIPQDFRARATELTADYVNQFFKNQPGCIVMPTHCLHIDYAVGEGTRKTFSAFVAKAGDRFWLVGLMSSDKQATMARAYEKNKSAGTTAQAAGSATGQAAPPAGVAKQPGISKTVTSTAPPNDTDPTIKALVDSVVQAVNEKSQAKYKALIHPDCLRDLTESQQWYLQEALIGEMFKNSIPQDFRARASEVKADYVNRLKNQSGWNVMPTHWLHIDYAIDPRTRKYLTLNVAKAGDRFWLVVEMLSDRQVAMHRDYLKEKSSGTTTKAAGSATNGSSFISLSVSLSAGGGSKSSELEPAIKALVNEYAAAVNEKSEAKLKALIHPDVLSDLMGDLKEYSEKFFRNQFSRHILSTFKASETEMEPKEISESEKWGMLWKVKPQKKVQIDFQQENSAASFGMPLWATKVGDRYLLVFPHPTEEYMKKLKKAFEKKP